MISSIETGQFNPTAKLALILCITYQDAPFHDPNWQLVRVKNSRKVFLWTYERNGQLCINVKVDPEWRDLWRRTYPSVIPGYHQNKEHWNTVILDGMVPEKEIKRMIAESYEKIKYAHRVENVMKK